jgi:methylmalonyl-CoA/ethylmalonyl-CoA epimerase
MNGFVFHHVGVAVKDMQAAIASYKTLFGYTLVSGPFEDPIQRVAVAFLNRGGADTTIELVSPSQLDSPIRTILKRGAGTYHVCYEVPDLNASIEHLTSYGSFMISGPVPAVAFGMRNIAWLMTETDLLVELLQA